MRPVADPVHDAEERASRRALREVVLHDDDARGPRALGEERRGILHVMEDVDEERGVGGSVGNGNVHAVEGADGDRGVGADEDVEALDRDVRPGLRDRARDGAAAAADVEDAAGREERGRLAREDARPPREDEPAVERADSAERRRHLRFSPRIERKNEESAACAPSVRSVTPGIIQRIVSAYGRAP